ncbi:MAG: alpha/beta fold hydrolase [Marinilabiliales bacterium]|nr:alpha/beta fold hydrolase [Marinilabiliales bacterium]
MAAHDFRPSRAVHFQKRPDHPGLTLRYETSWRQPNATRDNAVLIRHALSGDHHCAGWHSPEDRKPGWWNNLIGPGKAVDTRRSHVICANVLGGCQGSTGPSSINPATGQPYGTGFPFVTIHDMVRAQKLLLDHLGVVQLRAAIGGSMGGMQAQLFRHRVSAVHPARHRDGDDRTGKRAGDRIQRGRPPGDHAGSGVEPRQLCRDGGPRVGLAIARMMAHITYVTDASMDRKFGRRKKDSAHADAYTFEPQFEVEGYLRHQGQSFINRFDANSYLYITRAIDQFDLANAYGSLEAAYAAVEAETLIVGFTSDWLFPPDQNRALALALLRAGKRASYAELATDLGQIRSSPGIGGALCARARVPGTGPGVCLRFQHLAHGHTDKGRRRGVRREADRRHADYRGLGRAQHKGARPRLWRRCAAGLSGADEAGLGHGRGSRLRQNHGLRSPRALRLSGRHDGLHARLSGQAL